MFSLKDIFISCINTYGEAYFRNNLNSFRNQISFQEIFDQDLIGGSPLLLLKGILIISKIKAIDEGLYAELEGNYYEQKFLENSKNHIDFHMARYTVDEETRFDAVSLVIAIYCRSILDKEWKTSHFFVKCLEVVMSKQLRNGCWPTGISVSFSNNADIVQLPSVEIATYILESVFEPELLIDHNDDIINKLDTIIPGLRRFTNYLELTFQDFSYDHKTKGNNQFNGWSSDRLGHLNFTEAWITALTNRFFLLKWLIEKAYIRNQSLKMLGLQEYISKRRNVNFSKFWENELVETDQFIRPIKSVSDFCVNIHENKSLKSICLPDKDKVSFILFGPPGSGKTTIVQKTAESLDWPIIELSPGHFIKNGLELIETTSKEIFELISNVFHAVVLFDECDELFKKRITNHNGARTILSFATASMLPKIQDLHDNTNVLFILNTNFLHNIDDAIRRKGRFDELILLDRPDIAGRKKFIKKMMKELSDDEKELSDDEKELSDDELKDLAIKTSGFSLKDIINYCKFDKESEIEEYKAWIKSTGLKELDCSRYNQEEKEIIKNRWKEI